MQLLPSVVVAFRGQPGVTGEQAFDLDDLFVNGLCLKTIRHAGWVRSAGRRAVLRAEDGIAGIMHPILESHMLKSDSCGRAGLAYQWHPSHS